MLDDDLEGFCIQTHILLGIVLLNRSIAGLIIRPRSSCPNSVRDIDLVLLFHQGTLFNEMFLLCSFFIFLIWFYEGILGLDSVKPEEAQKVRDDAGCDNEEHLPISKASCLQHKNYPRTKDSSKASP